MAILKSSEGIIINATNSVSTNFGCRIYESTKLFSANTSGINLIQFTQNGATAAKHAVSVLIKFAAIRTSGSKNELPAHLVNTLLILNTNGVISSNGFDTYTSGGNNIMSPNISQSGANLFIGANNNQSTGIIGSIKVTVCTSAWDNLTVTLLSN